MTTSRSNSLLFTWRLALLCLAAQLLVAVAPLWHHHDGNADDDDQCSVCVAVLSSRTGDVPAAPAFVPPDAIVVALLVEKSETDASALVPGLRFARGPPANTP